MPMVTQEIVRELLDLIAVHGFYVDALEHKLGHPVPLPKEAISPEVEGDDKAIKQSVLTLHRWLAVLDLAVEPLAIRDAVKESLSQETAEALLRYYIDKQSLLQNDRDKTDCINTFLFKRTLEGQSGPPEADRYFYIMQMAQKFEQQIYRMLGEGANIPKLHDEHAQLLREFEFLHQEVDDFRTFDQLMDSGIVQRVRDLKQSFRGVFYHPSVLANVAAYNAMFGTRFDKLFHMTTEQIKNFAAIVQDEGASIMSKLDDDVIVKNLADVEGHRIFNQEYGKAQEHFRQISKFKKVMDKNQKGRPQGRPSSANIAVPQAAPAAASAAPRTAAASVAAAATKAASTLSIFDQMAGGNNVEDGKIRVLLDLMKQAIKGTEKSSMVQLPNAQMPLTNSEAEILRADFGAEKSFRADYALCLGYLLAMIARITSEHQSWVQKQGSAHLWKPHTDAIAYVVNTSGNAMRTANEILTMAQQRGLADKANTLKATISRLQVAMETTTSAVKAGVAR